AVISSMTSDLSSAPAMSLTTTVAPARASPMATRERMQALEMFYTYCGFGNLQLQIVHELLEFTSLTTRRRAELTLLMAELLDRLDTGPMYPAERVAVAQDALALAQKLGDRKMISSAKRLFKNYRKWYTPKRKHKPLRR
ncbi:MAG: hypothetical protein JWO96_335, partial [Candidatus Saccharibacteria bacterium]|nr:hypothetical protein [Candidatus Saccharibacteria bacterium]